MNAVGAKDAAAVVENDEVRDAAGDKAVAQALPGGGVGEGDSKPWHFGEVAVEGLLVLVPGDEDELEAAVGEELVVDVA